MLTPARLGPMLVVSILAAACGNETPALPAGGAGEPGQAGSAQAGTAGSAAGSGGAPGSAGSSSGAGGGGAANLVAGGGAGGASQAGSAGSAGQAQSGSPDLGLAKVLCIGDSITEQEASWIYPMQDALRDKTCKYGLIGLDAGPYNGAYVTRDGYDSKRVAAGGFSTTGILNLIKENGTGGVPDIVVEYLGVNNVYGGFIDGKYNPDNRADPDGSYIRDNKELFGMMRVLNPRVTFLLMKIENHALPKIDAAIDALVASESTADSSVIAVEGAENVETKDGIHPTAAGATTLSGPVGQALAQLLLSQGRCAP